MTVERTKFTVSDLLRVMERLRDPDTGCPWDVAQSFESIVPSTLEECYELASAIEQGNYAHVAEELGDVLFQVIFYAQLGREQERFSFEDIVDTLVEKLLRRHPHVFHEGRVEGVVSSSQSVDQVNRRWEAIKQSEREEKSQGGVLDDVPLALPALPRAQKLQKRAAGVGFDWGDSGPVFSKLAEELSELQEAIATQSPAAVEEEMGDVLFTCVNLARHLELDAETSLRGSSQKFESRFQRMEAITRERGLELETLDAKAWNTLWEEAKAL